MADCGEHRTRYAEPMYSIAQRTLLADSPKLAEWRAAVCTQSKAAADSVECKIEQRLAEEE